MTTPELTTLPDLGLTRRRVPLPQLAELLAQHPDSVQAFHARVWNTNGPGGHWYWLGAISSTGHAKVLIGSRVKDSGVIALAHRVAWVLAGGDVSTDAVIRHDCDETSCLNPACLRAGTSADNSADWVARRGRMGPLSDRRGSAGRARAIRDAILAAGDDETAQIRAAQAAAAIGEVPQEQTTAFADLPRQLPPIPHAWPPAVKSYARIRRNDPTLW